MADTAITPEQLKFGTKLHQKLVGALDARLKLSQTYMSKRYEQWATDEELFSAYIKAKDSDTLRKQAKKSSGEVNYVSIEVPYTYAIALTAHTYYTSVFLNRNPVLQFTGRHGASEQNVQCVEAVMDYQMNVGRMLMPLYVWLLDPLKYGVGFVGHYWDREEVTITKKQMVSPTFAGIPIPFSPPKEVYVPETVVGYEGNRLYNVRPQDAFPDPRVSLWNFQSGEFFGRYVEIPVSELHAGARRGRYFNVPEALKNQKEGGGQYLGLLDNRDMGSSAVTTLPAQEDAWLNIGSQDLPVGVLKGYELYLRLIPKDWGFTPSEAMEIWVLTMSKERVIIGMQPLGDASNSFPFDIIEHEPAGYNFFSRSMMEIAKPLNDIITWLFNTHFYNVRAALNNMFIVDPSMIEMADVEDPRPGKIFRLKPAAFGRNLDTVMKQFIVGDVTKSHVTDVQGVADLIQRIFGVTDNVMGLVNPGGRKTATEVRASTSLAVNRLKTQCELMSAMGFAPMAQKLLQRTQDSMEVARQFRIVGDLATLASGPFVQVDRNDIAGFYDYVPVDGTMPIDRFAQSALWKELMASAAQIPQIGMQYDFGKIFAYVATLAGAKNIQQFRLQVQVSEDAKLLAGVQAGNVVPLRGGAPGLPPSGTPEPGQVSQVGSTA